MNNEKKLKIVFVGIPDMALVCLDKLLENKFNIVGVVPPKKTHETYSYFKSFVEERNLNFIEFEKSPNEPDCIKKIKKLNADIGVICSYNNLLKKDFILTTKLGYINAHPSLLPDYRGPVPYFHIINNGEKVAGITLHFIDETFDTGDMVYQEKLDLMPFETMGTYFNRTTHLIANSITKVLKKIEAGEEIKRIPQQEGNFKQAKKIDGNFRIRWNTSSVFEIERLIRACNPFYNAFALFRGTSLKIISADAIPYKHNFEFGKIYKATEDKFVVCGKEGLLNIRSIHLGTWGYFGPKEFYYMFSPKEDEYLV